MFSVRREHALAAVHALPGAGGGSGMISPYRKSDCNEGKTRIYAVPNSGFSGPAAAQIPGAITALTLQETRMHRQRVNSMSFTEFVHGVV